VICFKGVTKVIKESDLGRYPGAILGPCQVTPCR
jgi:hypothetical protein